MDNSISNAASVASVRVLNKIVLHPDQIDVLGIDENLFNARTIDYFRAIESLYRDKADINETSIYERMTKDGKESDFGIIVLQFQRWQRRHFRCYSGYERRAPFI